MEILRVSPFADITRTFVVPEGYSNVDVYVTVTDTSDMSSQVSSYVSVSAGYEIGITLPGSYDNSYRVEITTPGEGTSVTYLADETYDLIRPYVDPESLATTGTATEIAEYRIYEVFARSLIDTYINSDFNNQKLVIQGSGQGSDYFPLWKKANRVLKVYENNVLIYDYQNASEYESEFKISVDSTAILRTESDQVNRAESAYLEFPFAGGDIVYGSYTTSVFPKGYDYIFVLDAGYKTIPSDVEIATKMLIEDIKCGKLEYYKRYTTNYSTDQYKIQFDKTMVEGTGNLLVDKILEKYVVSIVKPGLI